MGCLSMRLSKASERAKCRSPNSAAARDHSTCGIPNVRPNSLRSANVARSSLAPSAYLPLTTSAVPRIYAQPLRTNGSVTCGSNASASGSLAAETAKVPSKRKMGPCRIQSEPVTCSHIRKRFENTKRSLRFVVFEDVQREKHPPGRIANVPWARRIGRCTRMRHKCCLAAEQEVSRTSGHEVAPGLQRVVIRQLIGGQAGHRLSSLGITAHQSDIGIYKIKNRHRD